MTDCGCGAWSLRVPKNLRNNKIGDIQFVCIYDVACCCMPLLTYIFFLFSFITESSAGKRISDSNLFNLHEKRSHLIDGSRSKVESTIGKYLCKIYALLFVNAHFSIYLMSIHFSISDVICFARLDI